MKNLSLPCLLVAGSLIVGCGARTTLDEDLAALTADAASAGDLPSTTLDDAVTTPPRQDTGPATPGSARLRSCGGLPSACGPNNTLSASTDLLEQLHRDCGGTNYCNTSMWLSVTDQGCASAVSQTDNLIPATILACVLAKAKQYSFPCSGNAIARYWAPCR